MKAPTGEHLNKLVAIHVKGWKPRIQGAAKVIGWYDENERKGYQYKGIELPPWAWSVSDAFALLENRNFDLWTCGAGYGCEIYTAPEKGGFTLAAHYGAILPAVICNALVLASKNPRHLP